MKQRDMAQGLDALWVEEPLTIECQEAASASVTIDQDGNDEEPGECGDGEETQEVRDVIRGLEALWGKAPLPADFREVIAIPLSSGPAK